MVMDLRAPMGLRYHVVDIYVDELERVGALGKEEGDEEGEVVPLEKLLEPLRNLAKGSPTKMVRIKAKEALEDERLPGNEKKTDDTADIPSAQDMEDENDEWGGFDD